MNAKTYFKKQFHFEWAAGTSARTPDRSEVVLKAYEAFMLFKDFDTSDSSPVQDQVSKIIKYVFSAALA